MSDGNKAPSVSNLLSKYSTKEEFERLNWTGTFQEYLELARENPHVTRTAYQRLYDMIASWGSEEVTKLNKTYTRYKFFDDPIGNGKDAVFGLDDSLENLVNVLKSAALGFGTERRIILLHGPVGSAKSTVVRLLKKGLEAYSRTDEGALYTYEWRVDGTADEWQESPMREEPLKLIPESIRQSFIDDLFEGIDSNYPITTHGELNPACRHTYKLLLEDYGGDWTQILSHIRVKRLLLSEKDRVGIGTFQPKDEKNQDSTELTGDINYRKIAVYGSDSDPRAFNFDGEFNVANRGLIEFVEILKLDVAFLYDLLGATQEHKIKPKKFAQTDIDEVIIGHTNEPEFKRLQSNELMEAFRDRTVKIDIPYLTVLDNEINIYAKDYEKKGNKFIAPHTLEIAAMWAVLTRLEEPQSHQLSLMQKLKLYNGKSLPGFTSDNVRELKETATREGMEGISPRYIQDKISNAIVSHPKIPTVNPFMVMNELEEGLKHHSLIASEEERKRFQQLLSVVKEEYEDIIKNEVQKAISADEDSIARLCANYVDNVKAYTQREKVKNPYTGKEEEPDERLMRSIEEKIDIPESRKDDFRREIMNYIGALAIEGKQFKYWTNERLQKALELKLFEDQKDTIKLKNLISSVIDKDTQEKIDIVRARLIKNYGYDEISATDVLNYVASIYARGDIKS
ncbi:MAG: serine protein kinase [Planctomycetota bacterium]|nr:serine protein kinase [Planctomycetota bacterium]